MKRKDDSWTQKNQQAQEARSARENEKYGYNRGFIPILSLQTLKKVLKWFNRK